MQIIEKPVQKEDWVQDLSCPQCLAKLSANADDVVFIAAHTQFWGLEGERHVDDSYAVSCAVCHKSLTVSPIWAVQEFAKKKHRDHINKLTSERLKETTDQSDTFSFIWGMLGLFISVAMTIVISFARRPF